jgi:hypothetical protein
MLTRKRPLAAFRPPSDQVVRWTSEIEERHPPSPDQAMRPELVVWIVPPSGSRSPGAEGALIDYFCPDGACAFELFGLLPFCLLAS